MRGLTTGMRSEKCVVRRLRRYANVRECTYTNLDSIAYVCNLYNQRDATYILFFVIISALHVSGVFSAHHQELIKLYVQP